MTKVDFSNTAIAFANRSNRDLLWARRLFSVIKSLFLVKTGKVLLKTALFLRFPIGWIMKPTLYRHFVGGETMEKCLPTVEKMASFNVKSILDYSVEGAKSDKEFNSVQQEIARTIVLAAENKNIIFAVFKPTALVFPEVLKKKGFYKEELTEKEQTILNNFRTRVNSLCELAHEKSVRLLIDAEDVWYQQVIDDIVLEMMRKFNRQRAIVWNTWQMYRTDRLENLKNTLLTAKKEEFYVGVKFVRGAYMEKERKRAHKGGYPSPIHIDKKATDDSYNKGLEITIENIEICEIFNGTHNEYSSQLLCDFMEQNKIEKNDNRIWFSQLYGMSDHISYNLAHNGYNVTKYIPYGPVKSVAPYLIRRAEENTSIKGQTGRELSLLLQETKRRKSEK